jgi:hypothetical protein
MVHLVFILLLILSGYLLIRRSFFLFKRKMLVQLFGELYIPLTLFMIYGVSGLAVLFSPQETYFKYQGVNFEQVDVLSSYAIMCIVMLAVSFGFREVYKGRYLYTKEHSVPEINVIFSMRILLFILLIFDLIVRLINIKSGTYFSWMRSNILNYSDVQVSSYQMLQKFIAPLLVVLIYWASRTSKYWKWILFAFLFLVFLEGSRSNIFNLFIAIGLTHQSLAPIFKKFVLPIKSLIIWALVINFVSGAIVDIRGFYRADRAKFLKNPTLIVEKTVTTYIPRIFFGYDQELYPTPSLEGASLGNRVQAWQGSFSSQLYRLRTGWNHIPSKDFLNALALPVPSMFWSGQKPKISAGELSSAHFALNLHRKSKADPATTVFSDIYLYLGIVGSFLLALAIGAFNAFVAKFLVSRYHYIGAILFFGLTELLSVRFNSFANAFVNFRNQILVISLISILVWFNAILLYKNRLASNHHPNQLNRLINKSDEC